MDKPEEKPDCCQGVDGACHNKPKWRRQNTKYQDEIKNWVNMCDECFELTEEHWSDMWAELC